MIDLSQLVGVGEVIGFVAIFAGILYAYYRFPKVQNVVHTVLPFIPWVLSLIAARTTDKKGVFDAHDLWVVMSDVSRRLNDIIADQYNPTFADVQDDVFAFVKQELDKYRAAGVKGVPDVNDAQIKVAVKVVFDAIQRVSSVENTSGNNSTN